MKMAAPELTVVRALLTSLRGVTPRELHLQQQPLRGGLEAARVASVAARYRDGLGRPAVFRLVVKWLTPAAVREAMVYDRLVVPHASGFAPRLLGSESSAAGHVVLYLEALRPRRRWPWRELGASQAVLAQVARLHVTEPSTEVMGALAAWDYEAELQATAELTLEHLERARRLPDLAHFGASVGRARRVIRALPALRQQLFASSPLGRTVIHGDLHPGNVVLRRRKGRDEPVLLDWGRTRIGSPLEDVSCWLQSLGSWEPEARRRHDTLLAGYFAARGLESRLSRGLRAAYWLAGASNALSGALLHHLVVAMDERLTTARRARGAYLAREWLRILRRAAACWR
jgi:hypothetical protein